MEMEAARNLIDNILEEIDNHNFCILHTSSNENNKDVSNNQTFQNYFKQSINFPNSIVHYFAIHGKSKIYKKLIQSCKYFYASKKITPISYVCSSENVDEQYDDVFVGRLQIDDDDDDEVLRLYSHHISKIWITGAVGNIFISRPYILSELCKKIYKCEAAMVGMKNQILTEKEFNILVNPETVLHLNIVETCIRKANGEEMTLDEIIESIPNAIDIKVLGCRFTERTFSNIAKLTRKAKIDTFRCSLNMKNDPQIHSLFKTDQFFIFVTKNFVHRSIFDVILKQPDDTLFKLNSEKMKEFYFSFPKEERPYIDLKKED